MHGKRRGVMVGGRLRPGARAGLSLLAVWVIAMGGCGNEPSRAEDVTPRPRSTPTSRVVASGGSDATVVFLGDSLTAGYGLDEDQAFPALIADELETEGRSLRVVNAGVSGDTTAGGLARLDWLLKQNPDVLVVGLGGNDGLRGLDLARSEANLRELIERTQAAGTTVVLLGLQLPPNFGPTYVREFAAMFPRLALDYDLIHVPFMLEGVGGEPDLNLPDGIHPNARGQAIVAENILPYVRDALEASRDRQG